MGKTILITGSTDGIGLEAAKLLAADGHHVLLHGRSTTKLDAAERVVRDQGGDGSIGRYVADLSRPVDVVTFAEEVRRDHETVDVLINNAGVFRAPDTVTADGLDVRFAVNTLAPWVLTQQLLAVVREAGRVINLSSAAQAIVDPEALAGRVAMEASAAYAQSKLALTMWSRHLADELGEAGPVVVAVNPGSLLATNMVKEGYGMEGKDIMIGANILVRAAVSEEFASATGRYFDNDAGRFAPPHPDALDAEKNAAVVKQIEQIISTLI